MAWGSKKARASPTYCRSTMYVTIGLNLNLAGIVDDLSDDDTPKERSESQ